MSDASKHLRAIIAAWDAPHYGDLEAARDSMFEPIEAARKFIKEESPMKPVFFCMMRGLRGCYMPDDSSHYRVESFEQFAEIVRGDIATFEMAWDLDYEGPSPDYPDSDSQDGRVLALLREAWDYVQKSGYLGLCVAIDADWDSGDSVELNPSYGITLHHSSESEYNEAQEESE